MPRLGRFSPLGTIGAVRSFMHVVKEVDFDEVRGRAETTPTILLVADGQDRAERVCAQLLGDDASHWIDIRTSGFGDIDRTRYDFVLVVDPDGQGLLPQVDRALGEAARERLMFVTSGSEGLSDEQVVAARDELMNLRDELAPALGRRFPALRLAAVKAIVDDTAKANAQFALVSNVPAVVPIIGGLVAASADLIVLTKNQIMMVYKIAAVHDRNLRDQRRIIQELAPVVGSGFIWRTIAREAASFLPLAAGTIPKVAIAYVGTVVLGRAADYYYRYGKKPTREQLRTFTERATQTASRLKIGRGDEAEADNTPRLDAVDDRAPNGTP